MVVIQEFDRGQGVAHFPTQRGGGGRAGIKGHRSMVGIKDQLTIEVARVAYLRMGRTLERSERFVASRRPQIFACDPVPMIGQHNVAAGYANVRQHRLAGGILDHLGQTKRKRERVRLIPFDIEDRCRVDQVRAWNYLRQADDMPMV